MQMATSTWLSVIGTIVSGLCFAANIYLVPAPQWLQWAAHRDKLETRIERGMGGNEELNKALAEVETLREEITREKLKSEKYDINLKQYKLDLNENISQIKLLTTQNNTIKSALNSCTNKPNNPPLPLFDAPQCEPPSDKKTSPGDSLKQKIINEFHNKNYEVGRNPIAIADGKAIMWSSSTGISECDIIIKRKEAGHQLPITLRNYDIISSEIIGVEVSFIFQRTDGKTCFFKTAVNS